MKKSIILIVNALTVLTIFGQKPFKELSIDLDANKLDSILPVEQPFYINFISNSSFNLTDYKLIRVRTRKSYIPFSSKEILYYIDIPFTNTTAQNSSVSTKASKVTITESEKKNGAGIVQESNATKVSEYANTPTFAVAKYTARVYIEPLDPNFYYYLIKVTATQAQKIVAKSLTKTELNLFDALIASTTVPMGNTALDANENLNRHITATFGLAHLDLPNKSIAPYLGLRYSFLPVNKWVRQGMQEMTYQSSWTKFSFDKLALEIGITLNSIEDTSFRVKNTFGKVGLVTGLGYRFTNYSYLSIGQVWYNRIDEIDKRKTNIKSRFYASISLDWDIAKTFSSFTKLIGFSL